MRFLIKTALLLAVTAVWATDADATIVLYAQSSGAAQTTSASLTPMPGMQITLPAAAGNSGYALVTLCVPNSYAVGNNYPGAQYGIAVNGVTQPLYSYFTADFQNPQGTGRHPVTIVLRVPLTGATQTVTGMWAGVRGSTVKVDTPNSLSAVV
jgi:hypothetical protein